MNPLTTPSTLLGQVQQHNSPWQTEAWDRFLRLWTLTMFRWARERVRQDADAADVVQEVLLALRDGALKAYVERQRGPFSPWLRGVVRNVASDHGKRVATRPLGTELVEVAGSADSLALDEAEEQAVRRQVLQEALRQIEPEFQPTTWQAFTRTSLRGEAPATVAAELGLTVNAVYQARKHVKERLREYVQPYLQL